MAVNCSLLPSELLRNLGNFSVPSGSKALWQVVVWTAGYFLCKDRNEKVFLAKSYRTDKIVQDIKLKSFEWASRRSRKGSSDWEIWWRVVVGSGVDDGWGVVSAVFGLLFLLVVWSAANGGSIRVG